MPIFNKKFGIKSLPTRTGRLPETVFAKIEDDVDNFKELSLNITSDKQILFVDGIWTQISDGKQDEYSRVKRKNKQLENENKLLAVKIEIALDMLAEVHSELEALKNEPTNGGELSD